MKKYLGSVIKVLNYRQFYSIRTTQQTILKTVQFEKVNRAILLEKATAKSPEIIAQELKEQQKLNLNEHIQNLVQNDSNPENYIQVRIKQKQEQSIVPVPFIVPINSREKRVTITGVKRYVHQGTKKIFPMMRLISGKHVYEAIETIAQINKKAAKDILSCLQNVRSHAIMRGLDEDRLFVQSAITNKFKRQKRMRYRGKGTGNYAKRDTSQIRITLEERSPKDMFVDVIKGKTPPILAYQLKNQIIKQNAGLETIQRFQHVLTAKGRQQQKLMIKRRVQMEKKSGNPLTPKIILKNLVETQAEEMAQIYEQKKLNQTQTSLKERQTLYQRNEKLNI